jgi:hypothetical protein
MNMKKVLMIVVLMLCLVGAVKAQDPNVPVVILTPDATGLTIWTSVTDNITSIFAVRMGWEDKQLEVGGTCKWLTADSTWELTPDYAGCYLLFYLTQQGKIVNPPPSNVIEEWLQELGARPYGGLEMLTGTKKDSHSTRSTWLAGTLFSTDPDYQTALSIEYQSCPDEDVIAIGIKHRF